MGLFAMGAIGFGTLQVIGLSLVPKPPAIITACIAHLSYKKIVSNMNEFYQKSSLKTNLVKSMSTQK
jgi:hypothetical protein